MLQRFSLLVEWREEFIGLSVSLLGKVPFA